MLFGAIAILFCLWVGEGLVAWLSLPIPPAVVGMLVLFVGLLLFGRLPVGIDQSAQRLLAIMSLCFVPAGVGIMAYTQMLSGQWLAILFALITSTLIGILLTAWTLQRLCK